MAPTARGARLRAGLALGPTRLRASRSLSCFWKATVCHPSHFIVPAGDIFREDHPGAPTPQWPPSPWQDTATAPPATTRGESTNQHHEQPLLWRAKGLTWGHQGTGAPPAEPRGRGPARPRQTRRQHTRKGRILLGFSSYESRCTDQHTEAAELCQNNPLK